MKRARTVEELVSAYPSSVRQTAAAARKAVRQWLPGVAEEADATGPVIGFNFGPGYAGVVCTLILSKTGVKLGLVRGGELPDPHRLLEGRGKVHKYIALRGAKDLEARGVRELVKAAYASWKARQ